ncbi:MAG: class I SAM-dependent methyltransferase, partial [Nanoarchaeota archaeon]
MNIYEIWPELVSFEKRRQRETPFLLEQLADCPKPRILDAALGSGATTLGLRLAGVEHIVSNEIDPDYQKVAQQQAASYGVSLTTASYDWKALGAAYPSTFDAALCLGNSFTFLFEREEQLAVLRSFRDALRPNGKLIIDHRNYAALFLSDFSGKNYRWSGNYVYCGNDSFVVAPISITPDKVVMEYRRRDTNKRVTITMYPFKQGEVEGLLREAGFAPVSVFGDYKKDFSTDEAEFLTYVC